MSGRRASIIIATRDRPELLARAVESARAAAREVEVVVVDDASTPKTYEVCRAYPEVRYVRVDRNQGQGHARNLGLMSSGGEYVSFLDDDDRRLPGSLERQIEALDRAPECGLIYAPTLIADQESHLTGDAYPQSLPEGDVFWELLTWNFIPCPTVVFRRQCLFRVGLLDDASPGVEDWDLWVRIAELYPVCASPEAVAVWRRPTPDSGQSTSRGAALIETCARLLRDRWLKLPRAATASPEQRRRARRQFLERAADQLMWETAGALKLGRYAAARRAASTAWRLAPAKTLRRAARHKTIRFLWSGRSGKISAAGE